MICITELPCFGRVYCAITRPRGAAELVPRRDRVKPNLERTAVADQNALGKIGLMFVAATLFVMMTGAVVVAGHLTGMAHLDDDAMVFGAAATVSESR